MLPIAGIILLAASFIGGMRYADSRTQIPTPIEAPSEKTRLYTNEQWNFSVRYPAELSVSEEPNSVSFGYEDEPWFSGYNVQTEETPFDSTEEWLEAQPKGNFSSEGYELILWLDSSQKTAIVAEYVEYDRRSDGTYIHGRYFYAVRIDNGILYKFPISFVQFEEQGVPEISQDSLNFVRSFKPYID